MAAENKAWRVRLGSGRPITRLRVKNYKAVEDTGVLKPGGLTVFIGDNGVGKSSVLEALRFVAALSRETLDDAVGNYEQVRWKGGVRRGRAKGEQPFSEYHPIEVSIHGHVGRVKASATTRVTGQNNNVVVFERETLKVGEQHDERHLHEVDSDRRLKPDRSILNRTSWFDDWQFLDMVPGRMGAPVRRTQSGAVVRLAEDGHNLAEYLLDLRGDTEVGQEAFDGLLETLQVILPYAKDLVPDLREGFERQVALQLHEGAFTVPGWMLSSGTLRLVALLALLRHPRPPSLLCIEEIENGLDPRTIHLMVGELLRAAESGRTQVMITTHSPYLLDLVPLETLVLVERDAGKPPRFDRPDAHEEVRSWAEKFAPGRLYTMGTLGKRGSGQ